jgi:hypothetical protein
MAAVVETGATVGEADCVDGVAEGSVTADAAGLAPACCGEAAAGFCRVNAPVTDSSPCSSTVMRE